LNIVADENVDGEIVNRLRGEATPFNPWSVSGGRERFAVMALTRKCHLIKSIRMRMGKIPDIGDLESEA